MFHTKTRVNIFKKLLGDISTIALVIWSVDTTDPRTKNACLRAIATSGREYKVQKLTLLIKEMTTAVSARYGIIFPEKELSGVVILLLLAAQFMALEVADAKVEKAEKAIPAGPKENAAGREKIKAVAELNTTSWKQSVDFRNQQLSYLI